MPGSWSGSSLITQSIFGIVGRRIELFVRPGKTKINSLSETIIETKNSLPAIQPDQQSITPNQQFTHIQDPAGGFFKSFYGGYL